MSPNAPSPREIPPCTRNERLPGRLGLAARSDTEIFHLGGSMKVAVLGLGYVGTVTAAGLASRGHEVVGVDVDEAKVEAISQGRSPVVEPGIDEMVAEGVASGRLRATTDMNLAIERADVSLVCVGTPSGTHGETDLTYIVRALADLRDAMSVVAPPASGFHSVVIRSTVPPGTGEMVVAPAFASSELPPGWSVGTAMCPEFLREGRGVEDFFAPPFVVVGTAREHQAGAGRALRVPRPVHHVGWGRPSRSSTRATRSTP